MRMPPNIVRVCGMCLIGISLLQWPGLVCVYFLPLSAPWKIAASGGLLVVGGIFFWSGSLVLGGDFAFRKLRKR